MQRNLTNQSENIYQCVLMFKINLYNFRCSRQQVSLVSDCVRCRVEVTQTGLNPSTARDQEIGVGRCVSLAHQARTILRTQAAEVGWPCQ